MLYVIGINNTIFYHEKILIILYKVDLILVYMKKIFYLLIK